MVKQLHLEKQENYFRRKSKYIGYEPCRCGFRWGQKFTNFRMVMEHLMLIMNWQ